MNQKIILVLFITLPFTIQAAVCGRLSSIRGKVEILRLKHLVNIDLTDIQKTAIEKTGGESLDAEESDVRIALLGKKRDNIDCTDIIVTQSRSRAKIRLRNAKLTLGPNSRIYIAKYIKKSKKTAVLGLTYGRVRAYIKSKAKRKKDIKAGQKDEKISFRMKTFTAVAGVRGTDFYMSYEPNSAITDQATLQGQVEVEHIKSGEKVLVEKGQQVTVTTKPVEPPKVVDTKGKDKVDVPKEKTFLQLMPIQPQIKEQIKDTSIIAKTDKEFTNSDAVEILGAPETWKEIPATIPEDLKGIKNEF